MHRKIKNKRLFSQKLFEVLDFDIFNVYLKLIYKTLYFFSVARPTALKLQQMFNYNKPVLKCFFLILVKMKYYIFLNVFYELFYYI